MRLEFCRRPWSAFRNRSALRRFQACHFQINTAFIDVVGFSCLRFQRMFNVAHGSLTTEPIAASHGKCPLCTQKRTFDA